jgi:hypothetical protein
VSGSGAVRRIVRDRFKQWSGSEAAMVRGRGRVN